MQTIIEQHENDRKLKYSVLHLILSQTGHSQPLEPDWSELQDCVKT